MLVHEFDVFATETEISFDQQARNKMVRIDDELISCLFDTLKWIPSYFFNFERKEYGLNYYGQTLFATEDIQQLQKLIDSWCLIFSQSPEEFTLTNQLIEEFGDVPVTKLKKSLVLKQLSDLSRLCAQALQEQKNIIHFGI